MPGNSFIVARHSWHDILGTTFFAYNVTTQVSRCKVISNNESTKRIVHEKHERHERILLLFVLFVFFVDSIFSYGSDS